jgi:uncharacterized protein (DUF58 family)
MSHPTPSSVNSPHRAGRRQRRLTVEGVYWLLAAAILIGAGLFKGINLILLLGCLLLVVWVLHWFSSGRRIRRLHGARLLEDPIFAGRPFQLEIELHNPAPVDQPALLVLEKVHCELARESAIRNPQSAIEEIRWPLPVLARQSTQHFGEAIICSQRGRYRIGPLSVTSTWPFGLIRSTTVLAPEEEIVVLPRLGRVHRGKLRRLFSSGGLTFGWARHHPRRHPAAQADLHGVRAFRSGDSPRWIHWRTTARKGELMVREFEEMPTDNLILVLNPLQDEPLLEKGEGGRMKDEKRPADSASSFSLLEEAISMTASICWEWCRQTGDRLVLAIAGPEPVAFAGGTGRDFALRLLRHLAVQPSSPASNGEALLECLMGQDLPPAPVLVINPQPSDLDKLLMEGLRRPVASVALSSTETHDFFERDTGHAH